MIRATNDEEDIESRKLLLLLFGIALFVVSGFYSCSELNYTFRGQTAPATSARKHETMPTARGQTVRLEVQYEFPDVDGRLRKEVDTVPLDWDFPASAPVTIQFIPKSPDSSRLAGHSQRFWMLVFASSFIPIGIAIYKFWRFYKS